LKVIIAGAGLGGLATAIALARRGHSVTVFEQAPELGEVRTIGPQHGSLSDGLQVGAGIQIPANSAKLLLRWGIEPFLIDQAVEPEGISIRRWEDGTLIGYTKLIPDFRRDFGAPYYVIHRAHFHTAMHKLALSLGVEVVVNSKVEDYDAETPSLTLENGEKITGDLLVAADGIKSLAREKLLGVTDEALMRTGFAAYRATVDAEKMRADPDVAWLLEKPCLNLWIGHMRHVMTYTMAAGRSFNMVLSHPEVSDPSTWKQETALDDMKAHFKGWDPKLSKIIDMIDKTLKWPLITGKKLDHWVTISGKATILGDAVHAMVPYMSEGAAMAVEDGAALAEALDHISGKNDIPFALRVFEEVRRERAGQMQDASLLNGTLWHYADGPEQKARDAGMRPEVEGQHFVHSPNQWSDPVTQWWCYGYDAEEVVAQTFAALSSSRTAKAERRHGNL